MKVRTLFEQSKFFTDFLFFSCFLLFFSACQIGYLFHVSVGQMDLLSDRVSIKTALEKYDFTEEEKKKLELVSEIKTFARENLKLDIDEDIYSTYVQLDAPYITYLLRVSLAYELKAYKWDFPIIGSSPYKGFFDKGKAKREAEAFAKKGYDVWLRGVKAYSSLGWFEDPVLSSMLDYPESHFTLLIFHELTHTVLFFKDHINFNERFAEFVGRKATLAFYLHKEGVESKTVQNLRQEWKDELLFSSFMVKEYEMLDKWYKDNKGQVNKEMKKKRLKEIQDRFVLNIQPQLKIIRYDNFSQIELNNARLLSYRSYNYNMEEFEKVFRSKSVNQNLLSFIEYCSQFENEENPEKALSLTVQKLYSSSLDVEFL